MQLALVGEHRPVSGQKRVLDGVLGLLEAAQHVTAEGQQARGVAVVDLLEGVAVAVAHQCDEALVGL